LWGPTGEIVDYAAKQWAGLVSCYYKPRWELFVNTLNDSLVRKKPFNKKVFRQQVLEQVEIPFTFSTKQFPTEPKGDSIQEATLIFNKWKKTYRMVVRKYQKLSAANVSTTEKVGELPYGIGDLENRV